MNDFKYPDGYVPMTDDEIDEVTKAQWCVKDDDIMLVVHRAYARAVLARLGIAPDHIPDTGKMVPKDAEPVAYAVYLFDKIVDATLTEPELSHDYTWKPLYTHPPKPDPRRAELVRIVNKWLEQLGDPRNATTLLLKNIRDYLEE